MKTMHEAYLTVARPALEKEFGYKNPFEVPKIVKIVVNVGAGAAKEHAQFMPEVEKTLKTISGQKPVVTKAKRALASFKIRQGQPVGMMVTLRGDRMYHFLDRLINVALPRIRDFRGLSLTAVDSFGNCHLGLKDQTIFPEIAYEDVQTNHGLQVSIVTTAGTKEEAVHLLRQLGFPFAGAPTLGAAKEEKEG